MELCSASFSVGRADLQVNVSIPYNNLLDSQMVDLPAAFTVGLPRNTPSWHLKDTRTDMYTDKTFHYKDILIFFTTSVIAGP